MKSYRNFWSLNTDEAIVTGILRDETNKEVEVFMPINAQMKDIDLILINIKNKKTKTIQVKGSKAFEGNSTQIRNYGYGSYGFIDVTSEAINNSIADYFIFLIYVLEQFDDKSKGRVYLKQHTITISKKDLEKKVKKYKKSANRGNQQVYHFHIWINPQTQEAFDFANFRDKAQKKEDYSKYLDKQGLKQLNKVLK